MKHPMLECDIESVLLSEEEIRGIVSRIAEDIDRLYASPDSKLVLLCILKGSVVFMGDLMKRITVPFEIDFMKVSSYGSGTVTSGRVNIILDLNRKFIRKCLRCRSFLLITIGIRICKIIGKYI